MTYYHNFTPTIGWWLPLAIVFAIVLITIPSVLFRRREFWGCKLTLGHKLLIGSYKTKRSREACYTSDRITKLLSYAFGATVTSLFAFESIRGVVQLYSNWTGWSYGVSFFWAVVTVTAILVLSILGYQLISVFGAEIGDVLLLLMNGLIVACFWIATAVYFICECVAIVAWAVFTPIARLLVKCAKRQVEKYQLRHLEVEVVPDDDPAVERIKAQRRERVIDLRDYTVIHTVEDDFEDEGTRIVTFVPISKAR